jgi:hypothetical protein
MAVQTKAVASAAEQTIDELQSRYQALHKRQITAEANLNHAREQLERLKLEAREKFGTDDVTQLARELERMRNENEAKRKKYQADLDRIECDLAAVEERFASVTASSGANGET